eukprot:jgi/Picsp_1/1587/NSC_05065-R1_---NA---
MEGDGQIQKVKVIESFISGRPGQTRDNVTSVELVDSAFTRQVDVSKVTSTFSESIPGGFSRLLVNWNSSMSSLLGEKNVVYREGDRMIVKSVVFTSITLRNALAQFSKGLPPCKLGKVAVSLPRGPNEAPTIEIMCPDTGSNYFCCPMREKNALVMISMDVSPLCLALLCGLDLKRYHEKNASKEPICTAWFWNGDRVPLCRGSFNFLFGGLEETFQFSDSQLCASARTGKLWTPIQSPPGIKCNGIEDLLDLNAWRVTSLPIDIDGVSSPSSGEGKQMHGDENHDQDKGRPAKKRKENRNFLYDNDDANQKEEEEGIRDEEVIDLCDDNNNNDIESVTPHGKDNSAVDKDDGKVLKVSKNRNSPIEKHERAEKIADQNKWENVEAYLKSVDSAMTQNQEEIRNLRLQVQDKEKQVADVEKKWKGSVGKLAGEKRQMQDSVHKAQSEVSLLEQMNEELKRQVECLKSEKEKVQTEQVDPLQERVKNLENELHASQKESEVNKSRLLSDFERKSREYERSIQAAKEENRILHGQAELWKGKHANLHNELTALKKEVDSTVVPLIQKQEEQQIKHSKLKETHAKLERQYRQLTTESKQQHDLLNQKCTSMSLEISQLNNVIKDKKDEIDALGNQLHTTKDQLTTLEKNYTQGCQFLQEYRWCFYKAINGYRLLAQEFNSLDEKVKPMLPEKIQFTPGDGHPSIPVANAISLDTDDAGIQESERIRTKETAPEKLRTNIRLKKVPPAAAAPKDNSRPLYVSFEQEISPSKKHVNFFLVDSNGNSHLAAHGIDTGNSHYVYTNEPGFPELKVTNRCKVLDWGKGIIGPQV